MFFKERKVSEFLLLLLLFFYFVFFVFLCFFRGGGGGGGVVCLFVYFCLFFFRGGVVLLCFFFEDLFAVVAFFFFSLSYCFFFPLPKNPIFYPIIQYGIFIMRFNILINKRILEHFYSESEKIPVKDISS